MRLFPHVEDVVEMVCPESAFHQYVERTHNKENKEKVSE